MTGKELMKMYSVYADNLVNTCDDEYLSMGIRIGMNYAWDFLEAVFGNPFHRDEGEKHEE